MRVYRAISFSNLHYSVTKPVRDRWATLSSQARQRNWWMHGRHKPDVLQVISDVIHNAPKSITETSRAFSALQGGRFNAQKSHGALYCSENPIISALEVAYHTVIDALGNIRRIGRLEKQYTNAMNVQLPKDLDFIVVVFNLDVPDGRILEIDSDPVRLKALCDSLGYKRYTQDNFDSDFIFGNDYRITQIIGAHAVARRMHAIRVSSARLPAPLKYKNVIILDRAGETHLLSEYYLFRVRVQPGEHRSEHQLEIERVDRAGAKIFLTLENVPTRPSRHSPFVKNYPANDNDRIEKSRQVVVQKFGLR